MKKLEKLKSRAEKSDILFDGALDELIREYKITNVMASSLANDSQNVALISTKWIEAGKLISNSLEMHQIAGCYHSSSMQS